jgi:hypothetical protein
MNFKNIRYSLKQIGFYIPVTWYFVGFAAVFLIGYKWLQTQAGIQDSAYKDIFSLLLHLTIRFSICILTLGFLTILISYLFFIWKKRKTGIDFRISTLPREDSKQLKQAIDLHLHPILQPFLGFVKLRLKYDQKHFSDKFSLIKKSQKKLISTNIDGVYNWSLPEIKEYRIEKAIIYFEDFFQFFSIAVSINTQTNFHTQPVNQKLKIIQALPRRTEDTSTRIEELRKVEGEHINYKNFESNDDVRRIVWKIYAKNKELVVRIPEILDPYASHIYLYTSFFSSFEIKNNEIIEIPFLNFYKTIAWSVYKQLLQKGFEVRYVSDQDIPQNSLNEIEEQIKYSISVSTWQTEKDLVDHIKPKDASVVIISSLSNIDHVKELLEKHGNDISMVFVPLSESFNKQHIGDWFQWLFVQQEKDSIAVYKTNWSLSLLRLKILKNEKQLKQLLEPYQRSTVFQKTV